MSPILYLLGGPNGSGKTSFHQGCKHFQNMPFVNADHIAQTLAPVVGEKESLLAQELAREQITQLLTAGITFCFETVFSHTSKVELITRAQHQGYQVHLIVISTGNPLTNVARVKKRVAEGGHAVPEDKILARFPRSHQNLRLALRLADSFEVWDSDSLALRLLAAKAPGAEPTLAAKLPAWAQIMLRSSEVII